MVFQRQFMLLLVAAVLSLRSASGFSLQGSPGRLPAIPSRKLELTVLRAGSTAANAVNFSPSRRERMSLYAEMCRLDNLPASFVFVAGGAFAATRSLHAVVAPAVLLVALCTMMITATSMVANDYFDYQKGTDAADTGNVLTRQALTPAQAKAFVGKCYTGLLLLICVVPEAPVRLLLMAGGISTFLYTRQFKPVTWLKNASVAFICALAPAVGGMTAAAALGWPGGAWAAFAAPGSHCGGMVAALFFGIMAREILMDCVDVEGDEASGVVTVPVRYGNKFATRTALGLLAAMGGACAFCGSRPWLGLAGSAVMWARALAAAQAVSRAPAVEGAMAGESECNRAINEAKLTFPLVLASFL